MTASDRVSELLGRPYARRRLRTDPLGGALTRLRHSDHPSARARQRGCSSAPARIAARARLRTLHTCGRNRTPFASSVPARSAGSSSSRSHVTSIERTTSSASPDGKLPGSTRCTSRVSETRMRVRRSRMGLLSSVPRSRSGCTWSVARRGFDLGRQCPRRILDQRTARSERIRRVSWRSRRFPVEGVGFDPKNRCTSKQSRTLVTCSMANDGQCLLSESQPAPRTLCREGSECRPLIGVASLQGRAEVEQHGDGHTMPRPPVNRAPRERTA